MEKLGKNILSYSFFTDYYGENIALFIFSTFSLYLPPSFIILDVPRKIFSLSVYFIYLLQKKKKKKKKREKKKKKGKKETERKEWGNA